jgi:type II secretory pathway pseudopilin PulG
MRVSTKGFSIGVVLAVVVVVGLIIVLGWAAYTSQKNRADSKEASAQVAQQTQEQVADREKATTSNDTKKYMAIKEWGVKLPLDSNLGSLSYAIKGRYASIRSEELNKISGSCESNSVNVARGMASEIVPNEMGSSEGDTFLQAYNSTNVADGLTTRSIKAKSGEYYFVAPAFSEASCVSASSETAEGKAKLEAETKAMLQIVTAVNQLVKQ